MNWATSRVVGWWLNKTRGSGISWLTRFEFFASLGDHQHDAEQQHTDHGIHDPGRNGLLLPGIKTSQSGRFARVRFFLSQRFSTVFALLRVSWNFLATIGASSHGWPIIAKFGIRRRVSRRRTLNYSINIYCCREMLARLASQILFGFETDCCFR